MAIPNEALQKIIQEIETQAMMAQEQTSVVKAQIAAKQRDMRLLQLTADELKGLPAERHVYEGIGKMFVARPNIDLKRRLSRDATELRSDITNLEKKLHYYETTYRNSRQHMDQIIQSGRARRS